MSASQEDPPPELAEEVSALTSTFERAVAAIDAVEDRQRAYNIATWLADLMRALAEDAAGLRPRIAARIWEDEKLSLAGLANLLGVSRARAGQLVQNARRTQDQTPREASEQEGQ